MADRLELRTRLAAFAAVGRSRALRRVAFAYATFAIGEYATWLAMLVYAFDRGGAAEAGVAVLVQLAPSIVLAPLGSTLSDRFPRARVLVASYLLQAATMATTAVALAADLPAPLVYLFATLTATTITLTRPAQAALLPSLSPTPDALTAANVATTTIESGGMLVGPILAGALLTAAGPASVFATTTIAVLLGAIAVARLSTAPSPAASAAVAGPASEIDAEPTASPLSELTAGVSAIARDRRLAAIVLVDGWAIVLLGALDVFYVVIAFEILELDEGAAGLLNAGLGVGGLLGSVVSIALIGRRRLGRPMLVASLALGASVAVIAALPALATAFLFIAAAGMAYATIDIAGRTLIQRIAHDDVLGRVFGVWEGLGMAGNAIGAVAVPILIALVGPLGALLVAGASMPLVGLIARSPLEAADRTSHVPERELALLRGIPMFAPLAAPVIERLAADLRREVAPAGTMIIRQADHGDRYFIVGSGTVDVEVDGRPVRRQGPGEGFGEIALVRDVPRTATVRAIDDVELFSLERGLFLEAITGLPASHSIAGDVVRERLAAR
jgi:MFS family permease